MTYTPQSNSSQLPTPDVPTRRFPQSTTPSGTPRRGRNKTAPVEAPRADFMMGDEFIFDEIGRMDQVTAVAPPLLPPYDADDSGIQEAELMAPLPQPRSRRAYAAFDDLDEPAPNSSQPTSPVSISGLHLGDDVRVTGHTRSPIVQREPPPSPRSGSSIARQIQSFLPAHLPSPASVGGRIHNIPFPSAFSAPKISNVTATSSTNTAQPRIFADGRPPGELTQGTKYIPRQIPTTETEFTHHGLPYGDNSTTIGSPLVARPRMLDSSNDSSITFAGFFHWEPRSSGSSRRFLLVGYNDGLQIWDTTDLGEVQELLNLRRGAAVMKAGILPFSTGPLVGMIGDNIGPQVFVVYSLATHSVVKEIDFGTTRLVSFEASSRFIVISTTRPLGLHILNASTFETIYTVSPSQILPYCPPPPLQTDLSQVTVPPDPTPIFSLSSRLLAFASAQPTPGSRTRSRSPSRPLSATQSSSITIGPVNVNVPKVTQADLSVAALKVGGGLWGGMKALGGMALAAAKASGVSISGAEPPPHGVSAGGMFFSKSAPAASGRRVSPPQTPADIPHDGATEKIQGSSYITVLDLTRLSSPGQRRGKEPERIAEFLSLGSQRITALRFSADGTSIGVAHEDGMVVRVYQLRPLPMVVRRTPVIPQGVDPGSLAETGAPKPHDKVAIPGALHQRRLPNWVLRPPDSASTKSGARTGAPWHTYDLRRGHTSGFIEDVRWADDSRWVGVVSKKRTVHVFATNPQGGKPDEGSHFEGKVRNLSEMQPLSTHISPIARLRGSPVAGSCPPLVVEFIRSSAKTLPTKLLPAGLNTSTLPPPPSPKTRSHSLSPRLSPSTHHPHFQDILVFDPYDGTLSLRRLVLTIRSPHDSLAPTSLISGTSISLPGVNRLGISPPKSALSKKLQEEVVARDSAVATWNLWREEGWKEVKGIVQKTKPCSKVVVGEWLANAELSTHSTSKHILPPTIYLSHQFSFSLFAEDYHALLRKFYVDIPSSKLEVRKEVQVSAYPSGRGESFVGTEAGSVTSANGSSPKDIRRSNMRSSFDEPLASAMSMAMEVNRAPSSPRVIPMLPNGSLGSGRHSSVGSPLASFKAPQLGLTPIRNVAAGWIAGGSEVIGKVRSPRILPRTSPSGARAAGWNGSGEYVPLEFDEQDEDFLLPRGIEVRPEVDSPSNPPPPMEEDIQTAPTQFVNMDDVDNSEGMLNLIDIPQFGNLGMSELQSHSLIAGGTNIQPPPIGQRTAESSILASDVLEFGKLEPWDGSDWMTPATPASGEDVTLATHAIESIANNELDIEQDGFVETKPIVDEVERFEDIEQLGMEDSAAGFMDEEIVRGRLGHTQTGDMPTFVGHAYPILEASPAPLTISNPKKKKKKKK